MDPQRAYDVLSLAATRSAPLTTGRVCFFEFSEIHAAEVRACKSRTDCLGLPKKYVKACDAIEELEKGLENSPHSARMYRAPQVYSNKSVGKCPDPRASAIVPFVKTAPVQHPLVSALNSQPVPVEPHNVLDRVIDKFSACLKSRVALHYGFALKAAFHIMVYLPMFVLMCVCAYFVCAACYLAFHPVVLAKMLLLSVTNLLNAGIERVASDLNAGVPPPSDSWIPTWF